MYTFLWKSIEEVLTYLKPRECLKPNDYSCEIAPSLLECDTDHGNHEDADHYQ
jgi:hypothetical protein